MKTKFFILFVPLLFFLACNKEGVDAPESPEQPPSNPEPEVKEKLNVVKYSGDTLYIGSKYDADYDLQIRFTKCMFNKLMTFWQVGLVKNSGDAPLLNCTREPSIIINQASSDNIGPLSIGSVGSWFGGNHSYKEGGQVKTAITRSYEFFADGKLLTKGDHLYADQIRIKVKNQLFEPSSEIIESGKVTGFRETMCTETVEYLVQNGNIEVKLSHQWTNKSPYVITVYYGMQSMARGKEIFFPRGHTADFTTKNNGTSRNKGDYPTFNRFVQKGENGSWYESCYLTSEGIGNHANIGNNDFIYLVDYGKTYHRQLTNKTVTNGDTYAWRGIYSYIKPIENNNIFAYIIQDSRGRILIADVKSKTAAPYTIKLPDIKIKGIEVLDKDKVVSVTEDILNNAITIESTAKGSCHILLLEE